MNLINQIIDGALKAFYAAFSWAPPALGLTVLSAAVGIGMLWVFRKTSNQQAMKLVKRRVYASLLELRVFADEPAITWRAQKSLFAANLRYMGLALAPALWMFVPVGLLLVHLESFYGRAPLPVAGQAIVTMGMAPGWNPQGPAPELAAPPEVEVEGPPVRVVDAGEVSWRIRSKSEGSGALRFTVDGSQVTKTIETGARPRFVPGKSVRSLQAVIHPAETIAAAPVEWIDIRYPEASLQVFGFQVNWLVWFFVISMLAALSLKGKFGVVI
jgi:hypothetical protein